MINFFIYLFLGINVIVCVLLTLLVMMQRPKSEGLGAAFGGSVTDSIFGAQTSDVLTKMTIGLGGVFFVITLLLGSLYAHRTSANAKIQKELLAPTPITAPAEAVQPVTPATTEQVESKATSTTPATETAPAAQKKPVEESKSKKK